MTKSRLSSSDRSNDSQKDIEMCGVVMPISAIDGCDANHWSEVLNIVKDAVSEAGFVGELVSLSEDVGVIHRRIVQNLYENPIVVCDVSGKNPNVMFELGLRLAFDKPTIIIKDDVTNYSFDTSPIEHLEYPRSLRFSQINDFKENLKNKILATHKKSLQDSSYSPFLKHFGDFKVAKIDSTEVSAQEFIISEIEDLKKLIMRQERFRNKDGVLGLGEYREYKNNKPDFQISFNDPKKAKLFLSLAEKAVETRSIRVEEREDGTFVSLYLKPNVSSSAANDFIKSLIDGFDDKVKVD